MKKKIAMLAAATAVCGHAMAQMPVPLLDNDGVATPAQWMAAAPIMQAGLECRQRINPGDPALHALFPHSDTGQWVLTPPKGFAVFGLPVESVTIYIDPDGEMGASYTASVAAPMAIAVKAAKINGQRKTGIGSLMAGQGGRASLTDITCTVSGSRGIE